MNSVKATSAVLLALSTGPRWVHNIIDVIDDVGRGVAPTNEGGVYTALRRLVYLKMVERVPAAEIPRVDRGGLTGPHPTSFFRLTPKGQQEAKRIATGLQALVALTVPPAGNADGRMRA